MGWQRESSKGLQRKTKRDHGEPGKFSHEKDSRGPGLRTATKVAGRPGQNIVLKSDHRLQYQAEAALVRRRRIPRSKARKAGTAIVMDP